MVVDSHCHCWGRGFLPRSFFRRAAESWVRKAPDRTPDMIMPKLLDSVVDETGNAFIANMDRAGVSASLVMMIDVGAPLFGEEPPVTAERQIEYYAGLERRHPGRLFGHVSIDHRRPECLSLVRRAVGQLGIRGPRAR